MTFDLMFVDGIEKSEYENMLSVTFERPADNNWVSYSYQVEDLTGNLFAPNDPLSATDFYEGTFERSYYYQPDPELTPIASLMPYIGSFEWYDPNSGWYTDQSVDSSNIDNFYLLRLVVQWVQLLRLIGLNINKHQAKCHQKKLKDSILTDQIKTQIRKYSI